VQKKTFPFLKVSVNKGLSPCRQILKNIIHGNACMTLIINAFTLVDNQYLRRLVVNIEALGYLV
jgi:hypothetical protein